MPERGPDGLVTIRRAVGFDESGGASEGPGAARLRRLLEGP